MAMGSIERQTKLVDLSFLLDWYPFVSILASHLRVLSAQGMGPYGNLIFSYKGGHTCHRCHVHKYPEL